MLLESLGVRLGFSKRRKSDSPTFLGLPFVARVFVAVVIAAGATCLIDAAFQLRLDNVLLLFVLVTTGVATASTKIELPLGRSQSNLSLSHAVNFWALFALPPADAVCIAAVSAWAQCTLRVGRTKSAASHPLQHCLSHRDRVVCSAAMVWFGVTPNGETTALVRAAAVVAPLYFFVNSLLVAGAIALSTRQRIRAIWQRNFLWSAPSYLAGAALALLAHVGLGTRLVRLARAARAAAVSRLPQLSHRGLAPPRGAGRHAACDGSAARDRRSARARHRSEGGLHAGTHPIDSAVRGHARRGGRPVRRPRCRRCAPRRCCTTSATWRCPNTSCRSRLR